MPLNGVCPKCGRFALTLWMCGSEFEEMKCEACGYSLRGQALIDYINQCKENTVANDMNEAAKRAYDNVSPITPAINTHDDYVRECVADLGTPMVDAIDKAMRYAVEAAVGNNSPLDVPVIPPGAVDKLYRLVTLVARGAALRAVREERERAAKDQLSTPPTHPISQNAFIREVIKFNMIAGRSMDQFDPRAIALHTALQVEELREKLEALLQGAGSFSLNPHMMTLVTAVTAMMHLRAVLKEGHLDALFETADPVELLDGDIDVMVVSIGSMMSMGSDIFGAVHAVSAANLAKFPGGVCLKDKDQKVIKPEGWQPADLRPFLHHSKRPVPAIPPAGYACTVDEEPTDKAFEAAGVADMFARPDEEAALIPATVTGSDGVGRPNPAAGAPKPDNWNPVA